MNPYENIVNMLSVGDKTKMTRITITRNSKNSKDTLLKNVRRFNVLS